MNPPPPISTPFPYTTLFRSRAGSIVQTSTCRPSSAACRARAAAVVVLPTPPEPQTTSTRRSASAAASARRSEEHTSELQSRVDLVCRLLLEKKKEYKQHRKS